MKMLFVARAMDQMAGGLERMMVMVMDAMVARGHEVALFSWDHANAKSFYPMASKIDWYRLDMGDPAKKAGGRLIAARAKVVRRLVRNIAPNVIICFQGGPFMAMGLYSAGLGIPLVAAERTAPTLYDHVRNAWIRFVEHQAFRFAARITIQFERYRELYPPHLHRLMVTIPNPVMPVKMQAVPDVAGPGRRFRLLSVGRLSYQKNFGAMLSAFADLAPRFPDWDLRIVGEGEDRQLLEAQLMGLPALDGRVSMPGSTTDVVAEYAAAHLFCLPSRWEGFPNALSEALAHGLPAIGFEGCAGVRDLINPGHNGALASGNGDTAALAAALTPVMADAQLRVEMGRAAAASVACYRPETIFDLWEEMLSACAKC